MITYPTNKLQKVLLSGGCKQRNLPSGYTELEYIESTGTQYIDTGYYPNQNTKFEISGTQGDSDSALFGLSSVFYCFNNSSSNSYYGFCGNAGSFNLTMRTVPVILTMSATDGIIINGTKRINLTAGSTTADYSMALFGRINNNTGEIAKLGNHKINYAKIYENNILIHNYIPCRRKSDNVLGMYDTVTNTFFTNAGTGTFTAGADVVPTPDEPIDIVCNNGVLKYGAIGKNLLNKNNIAYTNSTILTDGTIISAENISVLDYIPVQPNTTYTYSSTTNSARNYNKRIVCFDANKNYITSIADTTGNPSGPFSITGTTPANTRYVMVSCANDQIATAQFEQGSTATPYEPYQAGIYTDGVQEVVTDDLGNTANAERLLAVGDYKDTQSVLDGVVTRNVGIKVLDGSEDWALADMSFRFDGNVSFSQPNTSLCTHFEGWLSSDSISLMPDLSIKAGHPTNTYRVYLRCDRFTTIEQLTSWLADQYNAGTPVIIIYPITEPTTEQVTPQPLSGSSATVTAGSIDNLPIESSTIAELKKRYIGDKEVKRVYIGDNLVFKGFESQNNT